MQQAKESVKINAGSSYVFFFHIFRGEKWQADAGVCVLVGRKNNCAFLALVYMRGGRGTDDLLVRLAFKNSLRRRRRMVLRRLLLLTKGLGLGKTWLLWVVTRVQPCTLFRTARNRC